MLVEMEMALPSLCAGLPPTGRSSAVLRRWEAGNACWRLECASAPQSSLALGLGRVRHTLAQRLGMLIALSDRRVFGRETRSSEPPPSRRRRVSVVSCSLRSHAVSLAVAEASLAASPCARNGSRSRTQDIPPPLAQAVLIGLLGALGATSFPWRALGSLDLGRPPDL